MQFYLKKDDKFYIEILENNKIFDFNQKVSAKYKNIINTLKKFPNRFGRIYLDESAVLDFIDEVYFENQLFKIEHSLHTLRYDFENFYIDDKKVIFLTNDYVLSDKIYKVYYIENLEINKIDKIDNNNLSVLFSNFTKLDIKGYDINYYDEIYIKGVIYIEEVVDKNLVFRVTGFVNGVDIDINNLDKVAILNKNEIDIFEIDYNKLDSFFTRIYFLLKENNIKFIKEDDYFILNQDNAEKFLSILPTIIKDFEIFGNKHLKDFNLQIIKPTLNVRINKGVDLLELDGEINIENQKISLATFLKQYKKENYIILNDKKYIINNDYIDKLQRVLREEDGKIKISFFDLPEVEKIVNNKDLEIFKQSKKFLEGFNKINNQKLDISINATLRDYQIYGIKWLKYLKDNNFGGCLADDMGLGKTLQAIAILKETKNSIVIVPKSLLYSWEEEIKKFAPNLKYYIYYGLNREFQDGILITTYGTLRSDIKKIKDKKFEMAILDEAQHIKNISSKIHKAVMLIDAKYKFALSGTPIENSLSELYSLFRFINSGMFKSFDDFKNKYLIPIEEKKDIEMINELKSKISPFILRRLKSEVLDELPPKQENIILVDMNPKHKELYQEKKEYYKNIILENMQNGFNKNKMVIFQALMKLRQIASIPEIEDENIISSKLEVMFEQLEDIISNKHKVLIFTNFLFSIDLIVNEAQKRGFSYVSMSGNSTNRQKIVDKFLNEDIDMFIMTLKTGGVGLNLTKADYVFIFEPWWNVASENQAIDRVYRIGQENRVFSYKLITKNSIEEKILKLQEIKKDISNIVDSSNEINLTQQDIKFILGE